MQTRLSSSPSSYTLNPEESPYCGFDQQLARLLTWGVSIQETLQFTQGGKRKNKILQCTLSEQAVQLPPFVTHVNHQHTSLPLVCSLMQEACA